MNRLERKIYDVVKYNPRLKNFVKRCYQSVFDIIPYKPKVTDFEIYDRSGAFFGFHDKTPFSSDDSMLLAMQYGDLPLAMPRGGEALVIGYYGGEGHKNFHSVTATKSWNWHQGCQLQWCGKSNDKIIFNDFVEGKNVSRVVSIQDQLTKLVAEQAISSVSDDGKTGIGYSFERVNTCMPGYGYTHGDRADVRLDAPSTDGLYAVDLSVGTSKLIMPISDVCSMNPDSTMRDARHYFSHALIAPGSSRVAFLHRWIRGDVTKRWSRMVSCNLDGSDVYIFPTSGMVSHIGWRDSNNILAYCRDIHGVDGYVLFQDQDVDRWERIGDSAFNSDGHPSFSGDGRWIITDTYPDRTRRSYLSLYDSVEDQRFDIALLKHWKKYATPEPYSHWACDLHPRWNRAGNIICFDSVYTGNRSLCTIDLSEFVGQISGDVSSL